MAVAVETVSTSVDDLELQFGGSLVEQLGSQLYPSATATVAELISNAWDADATQVWVSVPFDDWHEGGELVVVDDGRGMTHDMARDAYLIVGRKRRVVDQRDESEGGRKLHGRKGLGKLAAFGTAGVLECTTLRDGELTAFRLDYDKIRELPPDVPYKVEPVENVEPLVNPETGEPLEHGTRVRLTDLRGKRRPTEDQFRTSMSRRFSVSATEMAVWINSNQLERFDIPVQFRFPPDAVPDDVTVDDEGWANETISSGEESVGGSALRTNRSPRSTCKASRSSPAARWPSVRSSSSGRRALPASSGRSTWWARSRRTGSTRAWMSRTT